MTRRGQSAPSGSICIVRIPIAIYFLKDRKLDEDMILTVDGDGGRRIKPRLESQIA
jgi:hypothetical protein